VACGRATGKGKGGKGLEEKEKRGQGWEGTTLGGKTNHLPVWWEGDREKPRNLLRGGRGASSKNFLKEQLVIRFSTEAEGGLGGKSKNEGVGQNHKS